MIRTGIQAKQSVKLTAIIQLANIQLAQSISNKQTKPTKNAQTSKQGSSQAESVVVV